MEQSGMKRNEGWNFSKDEDVEEKKKMARESGF